MSFNCIKEINGLSKLVRLTDLTLSNNRIEEVDNLFELRELVFLSLNNNKISSIGRMLKHLRQLRKLQVLNCAGNLFLKEQSNYEDYVIFHLRDLKYINSKYIDSTMTKDVYNNEEKYKLEDLEEKGDDLQKKKDDLNPKEYQELNMMILFKYDENVLKESKELQILLANDRFFETSKNTFKESVRNQCGNTLNELKLKYSEREVFVKDYNKTLNHLQSVARQKTLALVQGYLERKEVVKLNWEDKKPGWNDMIKSLLKYIQGDLDRNFMVIETDFMKAVRTLDDSHSGNMSKAMSDLTSKIAFFTDEFDRLFSNFFEQIIAEARDACEAYLKYKDMQQKADEEAERPDGEEDGAQKAQLLQEVDQLEKVEVTPESEGMFDTSPDELVGLIQGFKEACENKHKSLVL